MMSLTAQQTQALLLKAVTIRKDIISMLNKAGSGHSAGALGMADIFTALYFQILKHDPINPKLPSRDRLVLSNGHICPALYATLARAGYFPLEELDTLRSINSRLQGHPHRGSLIGVETTSGPLGSGLSQSIGMALGARLDNAEWRVICLMSDGEHDEGNTWEAILFAGKSKLSNLVTVIDRNNIQIDGITEEILPLEPLKDKYKAFGWHVLEIDGHDFEQIINSFDDAKKITNKPVVIIAHTIPGKGVSFMENKYEWHGKAPNAEEAELALKELSSLEEGIKERADQSI